MQPDRQTRVPPRWLLGGLLRNWAMACTDQFLLNGPPRLSRLVSPDPFSGAGPCVGPLWMSMSGGWGCFCFGGMEVIYGVQSTLSILCTECSGVSDPYKVCSKH